MRKIIYTAVAGAAALAGSVALAAPAMASNGPGTATVVVSTQVSHVPDTTSGGTVTSNPGTGFGPIWAYDNVTKTFRVQPTGNGNYTVTELVNGTFTAFSEPNTGSGQDTPINVTGQMHGTNVYYEHSPVAPDPSAVPGQEPEGTGTSAILDQLFGGQETTNNAVIGFDGNAASGNLWVFSYHAAGSNMTQRYDTPSNTWGNITG